MREEVWWSCKCGALIGLYEDSNPCEEYRRCKLCGRCGCWIKEDNLE